MNKLDCKYCNKCGNCSYVDVDYQTQIEIKKQNVEKCLKEYGIKCRVEDTVGMFYPFKYRNKVHLSVAEVNNEVKIGFCEEESGKIVNIDTCKLHEDFVEYLIEITKQFVHSFKVKPYDTKNGTGILRYVVARKINEDIMVTLVVTGVNFAGKEWYYKKLKEHFSNVSLYFNINNRQDNAVFDKKFVFVKGERYLNGQMQGIKFNLSPASFYQINSQIATKMYKYAFEYLKACSPDVVLDLYSGVGITSNLFSQFAKVFSIESNKDAVKDAINNIIINGNQSKITAISGKCENVLDTINLTKFNKVVMFVDPARSGIEGGAISKIKKIKPTNIVYMSCNPHTLSSNLNDLMDMYEIEKIMPYDMFPWTNHIEVIATLKLK